MDRSTVRDVGALGAPGEAIISLVFVVTSGRLWQNFASFFVPIQRIRVTAQLSLLFRRSECV
jgi:hypothetical protein